MPRYEFETEPDADTWVDQGSRWMNVIVRCFGLMLLVFGFIVSLLVIANAWSLYKDPSSIDYFARAVERGSNLDLTLSSAASAGQAELADITVDNSTDAALSAASSGMNADSGLRFSYFVAWFIAILLLLLTGRLSISAIKTGGELALYDVKVGRLARALLKARMGKDS